MNPLPVDDPFFTPAERAAQARWGNPQADWPPARRARLLLDHIPAQYHARLEGLGFFFLATADRAGHCDCSFKGGGPGMLRIVDERTLVFRDLPGNQAFMSLGNLLDNPQVGLLFIDFATGERLRVNGDTEILEGSTAMAIMGPGIERAVRVLVRQVIPNCARHVPLMQPLAPAKPAD